jgi:hypothetical protein
VSEGGVTFQVAGLAELARTMKRAGVDITELKEANTRAAQIVADRGSTLAPKRTGRLAGNIRPAKQVAKARIMAGSASVPYAGPIHWGWASRNIEANPFLSNAAVETQDEWLAAYLDDIQNALDKVVGV